MKSKILITALLIATVLVPFQNCSNVVFSNNKADDGLTPLVNTVGVVTILLALGDQLNNQLVIKGGSSQMLAETMVRYASPKTNPRILVVLDRGNNGESAYDSEYIADTLLARYDADFINEPVGGLTPDDVEGYDLIWFNNPGYPMSQNTSKETLADFEGGVVISGDDMSRGTNFSMTDLTGLTYVDNGTEVNCGGQSYYHNDNGGYKYSVGIVPSKLPNISPELLNFSYGNDIDLTTASSRVEVIAYAKGGAPGCEEQRPVVVRYER